MGNVVSSTLSTLSYGVCGAPPTIDTQQDEITKEIKPNKKQKHRHPKRKTAVNINKRYRKYKKNNNHHQRLISSNNNMKNTDHPSLSVQSNIICEYNDDYQITANVTNYKYVALNEYNDDNNDKQQSFDDFNQTMDYVEQSVNNKEIDEKENNYNNNDKQQSSDDLNQTMDYIEPSNDNKKEDEKEDIDNNNDNKQQSFDDLNQSMDYIQQSNDNKEFKMYEKENNYNNNDKPQSFDDLNQMMDYVEPSNDNNELGIYEKENNYNNVDKQQSFNDLQQTMDYIEQTNDNKEKDEKEDMNNYHNNNNKQEPFDDPKQTMNYIQPSNDNKKKDEKEDIDNNNNKQQLFDDLNHRMDDVEQINDNNELEIDEKENKYNNNDKQRSFNDLKQTMNYIEQSNDNKERDEKEDDYNNKKRKKKNIGVCKATQNYLVKHKLCYIERDEVLTDEHFKMFNALRIYIDSILSKKIKWKLSVLQPKMLNLLGSDHKRKRKKVQYATPEMYDYLSSFASEQTLIAALTGSDYRLEIAKTAILETVQWRVIGKLDAVSPDMFEKSIKTKVIYSMNKRDKKGHLICYFKITKTPPKDPWYIAQAAIWTIEKSIKMGKKYGVFQTVWLIDLEYLKYSTIPPIEIVKEIIHLLQWYYPERLYGAYILFSPWVFRMVWKMISPLLTENTKSKIIVPKWSECHQYKTFKKYIHRSSLDKKFGGDLDAKYSYKWEIQQYTKTNNYTKL